MKARVLTAAAILALAGHSAAQCELQRLKASDGFAGSGGSDHFGYEVDLDGDRALIGSRYLQAAYVFEPTPFGWVQTAKLEIGANAGAVALSGSRALVAEWNGASAHLFELTAQSWVKTAELTPKHSTSVISDVALSGTCALIGKRSDYGADVSSGAVYFFEETTNGWIQVAKLAASNGAKGDEFGASVALSGSVACVGAPGYPAGVTSHGTAYVVERDAGGNWVQTAQIGPGAGKVGTSVDVEGARIAVGGTVQPAVYVFERIAGTWVQTAKLKGSGIPDSYLGYLPIGASVSLSGPRILAAENTGKTAVLFELEPTGWKQAAILLETLSPSTGENPFKPLAIALSGEMALLGRSVSSAPGSVSLFSIPPGDCPGDVALTGEPELFDVGVGGAQTLTLDAGVFYAGDLYLLLGSASGTAPTLAIDSALLPLAPDGYLLSTLLNPNSALLPDSFGILDASGAALAHVLLPAGLDPAFANMTLHHAFLVIRVASGTAHAMEASNPAFLRLGLAQLLLQEDFESGAPGWTFDNAFFGQWHLASAGECGAASTMAAYNNGAAVCDYDGAFLGSSEGSLLSPSFALSGQAPHTLTFTNALELDGTTTDDATVHVVDVQSGQEFILAVPAVLENGGAPQLLSLELPDSWAGRSVRMRFRFNGAGSGNDALGWLVDDVRVTAFAP